MSDQMILQQAHYGDYVEARVAALRAELDLVPADDERMKIHEKIVALYQEAEEHVRLMAEADQVTLMEFTKIKVRRLNAEIKMVREKMKVSR